MKSEKIKKFAFYKFLIFPIKMLLSAIYFINFKNFYALVLTMLHHLKVKRYGSKMLKFKFAIDFDYEFDSLAFNAEGDMIVATGLTVCNTVDGHRHAFFEYQQAARNANAIDWGATGLIGYPHAADTELRFGEIGSDGKTTERTVALHPFVQCGYVSFSPSGEYAALPGKIKQKAARELFIGDKPIPDVLIVNSLTSYTTAISSGFLTNRLVWLSENEVVAVGDPYRSLGMFLSAINITTGITKSVQISHNFSNVQVTADLKNRIIYISGWQDNKAGGKGTSASTIWCFREGLDGSWGLRNSLSIPWNSEEDAKCYALQYSPALMRLVAIVYDEMSKPLRLIDPETGVFEGVFTSGFDINNALAVSKDGQKIVIAVGSSAKVFEVGLMPTTLDCLRACSNTYEISNW